MVDLEPAAALKILFHKQRFSVVFQPRIVLQKLLPAAEARSTDQHSLHSPFADFIFSSQRCRGSFPSVARLPLPRASLKQQPGWGGPETIPSKWLLASPALRGGHAKMSDPLSLLQEINLAAFSWLTHQSILHSNVTLGGNGEKKPTRGYWATAKESHQSLTSDRKHHIPKKYDAQITQKPRELF